MPATASTLPGLSGAGVELCLETEATGPARAQLVASTLMLRRPTATCFLARRWFCSSSQQAAWRTVSVTGAGLAVSAAAAAAPAARPRRRSDSPGASRTATTQPSSGDISTTPLLRRCRRPELRRPTIRHGSSRRCRPPPPPRHRTPVLAAPRRPTHPRRPRAHARRRHRSTDAAAPSAGYQLDARGHGEQHRDLRGVAACSRNDDCRTRTVRANRIHGRVQHRRRRREHTADRRRGRIHNTSPRGSSPSATARPAPINHLGGRNVLAAEALQMRLRWSGRL